MSDKSDFPVEELMAQAFGMNDETGTERTLNVNVRIEIEVVE